MHVFWIYGKKKDMEWTTIVCGELNTPIRKKQTKNEGERITLMMIVLNVRESCKGRTTLEDHTLLAASPIKSFI